MSILKSLRRLLGHDDKFFDLLDASAAEAQNSIGLLIAMLRNPENAPPLEEFVQARRKDKRITEQITAELCRTFVTPLEREDIEALSFALYRIPKTAEKFCEKFLLCRDHLQDLNFACQVNILEEALQNVSAMVSHLREHTELDKVKEQNDRLHSLEGEADTVMMVLVKDLYSGQYDPLKVIIILDLSETLEKIIDRCRDAGNIIFQIVLKYS